MYANVSEEYSNNLGSFATRDFNIFVNSKDFQICASDRGPGREAEERAREGRGGENRGKMGREGGGDGSCRPI